MEEKIKKSDVKMWHSVIHVVKYGLGICLVLLAIAFMVDMGYNTLSYDDMDMVRFVIYLLLIYFFISRLFVCSRIEHRLYVIENDLDVYYPWMKKLLYENERAYKRDVLKLLPFVLEFQWLFG